MKVRRMAFKFIDCVNGWANNKHMRMLIYLQGQSNFENH